MAGRGTDIQLGGNVEMRVASVLESTKKQSDPIEIQKSVAEEVNKAKKLH